jgi:Ca2+/Na+ antiporter
MMDEATRQAFKFKFIKLTLLLDVIVLLAAFSVLAFFLLGPNLNLLVSVLLAALAIGLGVYSWRSYKRDKAWLQEQNKEKTETE